MSAGNSGTEPPAPNSLLRTGLSLTHPAKAQGLSSEPGKCREAGERWGEPSSACTGISLQESPCFNEGLILDTTKKLLFPYAHDSDAFSVWVMWLCYASS